MTGGAGLAAAANPGTVLVPDDSERCEVSFAPVLGGPALAAEAKVRCPEPAVMVIEAVCACGHGFTERSCTGHGPAGNGNPNNGGYCGRSGHLCPVTVTRVI